MREMMTFRGKYAFLSNMYEAPFTWDGRPYRNSEAAFQSAKTLDPAERDRFSVMPGATAKREGKKVALRRDWEAVKDDIMEEVVRGKFLQNPELLRLLLDTGDTELTEGNRWHDTYWGVDIFSGQGLNRLGEILMKLRAELGGADWRELVRQRREERQEERQREDEALEAAKAELRAQLDALPKPALAGREMRTKAFGKVTILRQEGDFLWFTARGQEKRFLLPDCVLQGFLIPDDPEIPEICRQMQALRKQLRELEENGLPKEG